ncbi:MAG: hypothetical protein ACRDVW_03630 [Acidimicrobiales bacterium]
MKKQGQSARARVPKESAAHDLLPFRRTVVATTTLRLPFGDVKRAARICLTELVQAAFGASGVPTSELIARVPMLRWSSVMAVPVDVEVRSVRRPRTGLVAHLHWHARRGRGLFPVMDADLLARPRPDTGTELVLEGTYHPPLGVLGLAGDVILGHRVARSTAKAFVEGLGGALEEAASKGRCGAGSARRTGEAA